MFFSSIPTTQFYCPFSPTTTAVIPLSSLLLYHTAIVTLFSLLLLHQHIYDFVVVLLSPPIQNRYAVLPSLKATGRLYCLPVFFATQLRLCSLLFYTTTTILLSSFLLDHTLTVTLSSPLHHYQHSYRRRPSFPTAQTQLCCLPFSIITTGANAVVMLSPLLRHGHHPHNFWSSFLHTRRLMLLFPLRHRCHHNFIVVLSCSPLYHSYRYVIFHPRPPPPQLYCRLSLFATLSRLHCLPSSTTPLRLCCLLFSTTISTKKLQKSCLGAVNPVTVLPKVLVYFVFLLLH